MEFVEGNFLGLPEGEGPYDLVVLPIPYELTTSYGQGTAQGPAACIEASGQVELFDVELGEDLPAGLAIKTQEPWGGEGNSLQAQLQGITAYLQPHFDGNCFPLALGGEHGILTPLVKAASNHPSLNGDLSKLTIVQSDAPADLRAELEGEPFSHACAAARSLDQGVGRLIQAGIRAFSKEEFAMIQNDERITTFFAKDTQNPCTGAGHWQAFLDEISAISGPVHLTIDIDGLDGSLVPATGTPVAGGLTFWQVIQTIETLFSNSDANIISADVNEIVEQEGSPLTQFTAAMIATKIVAMVAKSKNN